MISLWFLLLLGTALGVARGLARFDLNGRLRKPTWEEASSEQAAKEWLQAHSSLHMQALYNSTMASWTYTTDLTDRNLQDMVMSKKRLADFNKMAHGGATAFRRSGFSERVRRQLFKVADIGSDILPAHKVGQVNELKAELNGMYSKAQVCGLSTESPGKCYHLAPDLEDKLAESRDWDELLGVWKGWRDVTGPRMMGRYADLVELQNEAARTNSYADVGAYWRSHYETADFRRLCATLWSQVKPLYQHLHAYTRRQLKSVYRGRDFPDTRHIPAHILGNMWSQQWNRIEDILRPFPNAPSVDVTDEMVRQVTKFPLPTRYLSNGRQGPRNVRSLVRTSVGIIELQEYDVLRMIRLSEAFFTSLGFRAMPASFWRNSMFVRPTDREVVCHASAWDFSNQRDFRRFMAASWTEASCLRDGSTWHCPQFTDLRLALSGHRTAEGMESVADVVEYPGWFYRIKQCTEVTMDWLSTTHHEMGHVEYFLEYKHLPTVFRRGANPGFHEAIGDVMELSVSTPEHLQEIGLLRTVQQDEGADLNFLLDMALRKVAFLPFGYLVDQWRWGVFSGKTTPQNYNRDWWKLRCSIQGISPPVPRSDEDFDPGAKFHIPNDVPYIRYFIADILQFQIHKALCDVAGNTRPLHRCDIYQNRQAGALLRRALQVGSSSPWPEVLRNLTGSDELSAEPLLEYFRPLQRWLERQNEGHDVTWQPECPDGSLVSSGSVRRRLHVFYAIFVIAALLVYNISA